MSSGSFEDQYETEMEDYNQPGSDMEEDVESELEIKDYNELPTDMEEKDMEEEFQEVELQMDGENEEESEIISDSESPFSNISMNYLKRLLNHLVN